MVVNYHITTKEHELECANYIFLFLLKVSMKEDPTDSTLKKVPQILQEFIGDRSRGKGREGRSPSAFINGIVLTHGGKHHYQQKEEGVSASRRLNRKQY